MSEELYFNDELRKCLNAAGLSDCGENDAWNYWYHRVHKAHDQAVDRVTEAQRTENAKLREELEAAKHDLQVFSMGSVQLESENAKLREQMERLVTLLRVDCDIDASWDGLRRFWSIELTEGGCLMRDRACKAEADNDKLLELVRGLHMAYVETLNECESLDEGLIWEYSGNIDADVAKSRAKFKADRHRFDAALRELGVDA